MSAGYALYTPASVALTAATAKTVLLAIAPAGHGLLIAELSISFDGVTAANAPALVEIVVSTQATAGTATGSPTITQIRGRSSGGQGPAGGYGYTAEPTVLTAVKGWFEPQFMGLVIKQDPLGREMESDSSAGGTLGFKAIGIRVNSPNGVNCRAYLDVEAVG